jgi:hypothetical protein
MVQTVEEAGVRCWSGRSANHVEFAQHRDGRVARQEETGAGDLISRKRKVPLEATAESGKIRPALVSSPSRLDITPRRTIVVVDGRTLIRACSAQCREAKRGKVAGIACIDIAPVLGRLVPQVPRNGVRLGFQRDLGVPPNLPSVAILWFVVALRRPNLWHAPPRFRAEEPARMPRKTIRRTPGVCHAEEVRSRTKSEQMGLAYGGTLLPLPPAQRPEDQQLVTLR